MKQQAPTRADGSVVTLLRRLDHDRVRLVTGSTALLGSLYSGALPSASGRLSHDMTADGHGHAGRPGPPESIRPKIIRPALVCRTLVTVSRIVSPR